MDSQLAIGLTQILLLSTLVGAQGLAPQPLIYNYSIGNNQKLASLGQVCYDPD